MQDKTRAIFLSDVSADNAGELALKNMKGVIEYKSKLSRKQGCIEGYVLLIRKSCNVGIASVWNALTNDELELLR